METATRKAKAVEAWYGTIRNSVIAQSSRRSKVNVDPPTAAYFRKRRKARLWSCFISPMIARKRVSGILAL